MAYLPTIVLVCMGMLIGFLAQRSRMCFVAGIRDYILVRDRELLMGMISFILTIWLLTSLLYGLNMLRSGVPEYGPPEIQTAVNTMGSERFDITRLRSLFSGAPDGQIRLLLGSRFLYITLIGGLIIGLISTLAGGCVLRQHVLLAQGSMDSLFFIAGFYTAVLVYYGFLHRFFIRFY